MEINNFYHGDTAVLIEEIPNNFIDLTVTSPPYDNLRDYKGYSFDFEKIAMELYRVTKEGGVVVWVIGDQTINGSETGTSFRQALFFMQCGFNLHDTMIYEKTGCPFPEQNRYYPIFEYMFIFSKGKPKTTNLINDRVNTYAGQKVARKSHARQKDGSVKENSAYRNEPNRILKDIGVRFNIWRITSARNVSDNNTNHPAPFPDELAKDHILSWSNEGDLVFDPFAGSGTTLKMAQLMKRDYLGFEIADEYIPMIKERLKQKPLHHFSNTQNPTDFVTIVRV